MTESALATKRWRKELHRREIHRSIKRNGPRHKREATLRGRRTATPQRALQTFIMKSKDEERISRGFFAGVREKLRRLFHRKGGAK